MRALASTPMTQKVLRFWAVVAVLFGVLLMHSLPLTLPVGEHAPAASHSAAEHEHPGDPAAITTVGSAAAPAGTTYECNCTSHSTMHPCVAVLTIAVILLVATRFVTNSVDALRMLGRLAWPRSYASRSPPWTVPTLAQLSVLRV